MPGPETAGERNLTRQTLSGMKWTYVQMVLSAGLQIAVTAFLARLLTPAAFGLVALADLTLRFVNYVARAGVGQAIIQKPDLEPIHVRAGVTASIGLGLVFAAGVWVLAPVAALFFDDPSVTPVLRWMSLSLLLQGLGATAEGLLTRELRFQALAVRSLASYVIGYPIVGLTLAFLGAGVWSLVAAALVQTAARSLFTYLARPHTMRPTLNGPAHRSLLAFGGRVSLISFFEFLGSELDTLVVGRFAGASALGLYNRAYILVRLPVYYLTTSFSRVLFPAFSSVQHDVRRFRGAYVSAAGLTAAVIFPTAAGIAVAGAEIVQVVLGDQWTEAIPILPWIAVASALSMVTHLAAVSTEARAELNAKIAISVAKVAVLGGLLVLATGRGLWAYGAALAGASLFAHVAYVLLVGRTLQAPLSSVLAPYPPALVTAGTVAATIFGVRLGLLALGAPSLAVLTGEVAAGALVLWLQLRFGVLRTVRRDVTGRLVAAGLMEPDGDGHLQRFLLFSLGAPAPPPAPPPPTASDGEPSIP